VYSRYFFTFSFLDCITFNIIMFFGRFVAGRFRPLRREEPSWLSSGGELEREREGLPLYSQSTCIKAGAGKESRPVRHIISLADIA
jgi:hypothetical protein